MAALINSKTLEEEEQEDEPTETLICRRQTSDKGHKGEKSSPMEDIILEPLPEEPHPRKVSELVQQESVTKELVWQDIAESTVQDMVVPVDQEPVIELPALPQLQQAQFFRRLNGTDIEH